MRMAMRFTGAEGYPGDDRVRQIDAGAVTELSPDDPKDRPPDNDGLHGLTYVGFD